MRSEFGLLEKFTQYCHSRQEGLSETYITQIYNNMQELLLVQFLNEELQHQQSKVDELQAKFDQHDQWLGQRNRDVQELNDIIAKHVTEKDELQKRVDAGSGLVKKYHSGEIDLFDLVDDLEQALKGGSDEAN